MDKEVRIVKFNNSGAVAGAGDGDERVMEWEDGLPCLDDLTPLCQTLIPPELATAFRITAEPPRTLVDVNRESKNTIASIRSHNYSGHNNFKSFEDEEQNPGDEMDLSLGGGLVSNKVCRIDNVVEESDSVSKNDNTVNYSDNVDTNDDVGSVKSSKRPRLVWTPQLHKRFVDVVAHLGIKNAVPKTIMTLMNVEGLTRENVASHLQKYRLYLKRMRGLSDEGPSASDHLFASTPVPRSLQEGSGGNEVGQHGNTGNGHIGMHIPMSYPPPPPPSQMMHMSYMGMAGNGHGHFGMPPGNGYHGYEAPNQYNMMQTSFQQYHNRVTPNDN